MKGRDHFKKAAFACFQGWCAVGRRVRAEDVGDAGQRTTAMKDELSVGVVQQPQTIEATAAEEHHGILSTPTGLETQ